MAGSGGSIRQRKTDLWEGRWWHDGKRRSVYAPTKREIQAKLRKAIDGAEQGIKPTPSRLTVAQHMTAFVEAAKTRCRPSTYASYAETTQRYILPALGRIPLARLEPADVQGMLDGLPATLSPTTRRYTLVVLRAALNRGVRQGLLVRNVAGMVDMPAKARTAIHPMTVEQVRTLLASVEGQEGTLYLLAVTTGLRQGELLGLRWDDLDGDRLTVRHTLSRQTRELGEPKTAKGRRTVSLTDDAVKALREHRVAQLEQRVRHGRRWHDGGYVFTGVTGSPLHSRNVTQRFQAALKAAGLPRFRFHDTRHTAATLLLAAGVSLHEVSWMLGHSSVSITADIYGHATERSERRVAMAMQAALSG